MPFPADAANGLPMGKRVNSAVDPGLSPEIINLLSKMNFTQPQEVQGLQELTVPEHTSTLPAWNITPMPGYSSPIPPRQPVQPDYKVITPQAAHQQINDSIRGINPEASGGKFQYNKNTGELFFVFPKKTVPNGPVLPQGNGLSYPEFQPSDEALARYNSRDNALNLAAQSLINGR
jgi:hypothetical protein